MKNKIIFALVLVLAGCATSRTILSDKSLRTALHPDSISPENYAKLQAALVQSKKFVIIDRATGFAAIQREQELEHRDMPARFSEKEKYSMWGRMMGVGSIIVAHTECSKHPSLWQGKVYLSCTQILSIVDSNTGEVIATAQAKSDSESVTDNVTAYPPAPEWTEVVQQLVENYPEVFEDKEFHGRLKEYRKEAEENARVPATDK